jgi:hypothetical protein
MNYTVVVVAAAAVDVAPSINKKQNALKTIDAFQGSISSTFYVRTALRS